MSYVFQMTKSHDATRSRLLDRVSKFAGRRAQPTDRIYADLDINGSDFIEFVADIEQLFGVDLDWVSPRDSRGMAQDPTVDELAADVTRQLGVMRN